MEKVPYLLLSGAPIGPIAERHLIKSHYAPKLTVSDTKLTTAELIEIVETNKIGLVLVVGYGKILKQDFLDSVGGQVLNIHPSLLPEYRGPAPVVQAILDGVEETGVSLMEIDAQMDHGPVLGTDTIRLSGRETASELYEILTYRGVTLFLEHVENYVIEEHIALPQQDSIATYTKFVKKEDGLVDLSTHDHEYVERMIRAYEPWPGVWLMANGKRLIIKKAHLNQEGQLIPEIVQPEGGKPMPFAAWAAGHRMKEPAALEWLYAGCPKPAA